MVMMDRNVTVLGLNWLPCAFYKLWWW